MLSRSFYSILILFLAACATPQPLSPKAAQAIVEAAWQADQHAVWVIDWPSAPLGGPFTVEVWRSGDRYRFEILETTASPLIGETLIVAGETAWRYNRFDPPAHFLPTSPVLSPVTDLLALVDQLLKTPAIAAEQETVQIDYSLARKIRLTFEDGNSLVLGQEMAAGLPVRLVLWVRGQQITLEARDTAPLPQPPPGLFEVGEWVYP